MKVHQEPEETMARMNIERRIVKAMRENTDVDHIIRDVLTTEFVCSRPEINPEEFKKIFELVYDSNELENYFSTLRGIIHKVITNMQFVHDDATDYETFATAIANEVNESEEFSNLVKDFNSVAETYCVDIDTEDIVRYIVMSIVITTLDLFRGGAEDEEAPSELGDFQTFINRQNVQEAFPTTTANTEERIDMSTVVDRTRTFTFANGSKAHPVKPKNTTVIEAAASTSTDNEEPIKLTEDEIKSIKEKFIEMLKGIEKLSKLTSDEIAQSASSIVDMFIQNMDNDEEIDDEYATILLIDCLTHIKSAATKATILKVFIELCQNGTIDKIVNSVLDARKTAPATTNETPAKVEEKPVEKVEKNNFEPIPIPENEMEGVTFDDNGVITNTGKMSSISIIMNKDRIEKSAYNKAHRTHIRLMCGFN